MFVVSQSRASWPDSYSVTVKTFELLLDQGWIWLDFPDFKHDYLKQVCRSDVGFLPAAVRGPVICTVISIKGTTILVLHLKHQAINIHSAD